jgi:hypothetical protein
MRSILSRLWYGISSSTLVASYREPAVWFSAVLGVLLIVVSFIVEGRWANVTVDAGVTVLLVPPLVAVQLRAEKVIALQPADLEGLPDVAKEALPEMGTIPARRAADFYRSDIVVATNDWLGGIQLDPPVLFPTHTSATLCIAQQLVFEAGVGSTEEQQARAEHLAAGPGEHHPEEFQLLLDAGRRIRAWFDQGGVDLSALSVGTQPRPRGKDLHALRFVLTSGKFLKVDKAQWLDGFTLLMHREADGWKVANLQSEEEPAPGLRPDGLIFM